MGYLTRHLKSDGKTHNTYTTNGEKHELGVTDQMPDVCSEPPDPRGPKKVQMNLGADVGYSKAKREAQIRTHLNRCRADNVATNGWSKGGTMRHIGSIPAEHWWGTKFENGPESLRDPKELKKYIKENDFNVVSKI